MSYGLCVLWGEVTDVVIPPFSSSFSAARNNHAEAERARKWCGAACPVPRTAASAAPPPYLGNDHLSSKRPRVRHYPRSQRRWRAKGMATGAARADVPHLSPGGRLRAPVLTANPQRKESNQGSWAPNTGIMVPSLGKPHIYSLMGSYKSSPAVVYQITPGSRGRRWTSHHTLHVPVTFGQAVSTGYNPTQRLHACMHACNKPVFCLHQQAWT